MLVEAGIPPTPVPLLDVRGVSKSFPGVTALNEIGFALAAGEVIQHIGARPQVSLKELAQQRGLPV